MKFSLLYTSLLLLLCNALYSQENALSDYYNTNEIKEIHLSFNQQNWAEILDSFRVNGKEMLIGKARLDGETYENVGVRYRDNRSSKAPYNRNALVIKLNFIDMGQSHQGYQTLKLSNSTRDPSLVREVIGYEIARKYMVAPKANYVKVYINHQYYGLYVSIETIDGPFLNKHFGNNAGTLVKCTPKSKSYVPEGCLPNVSSALVYEDDANCYLHNYSLESKEGWNHLIKFTKILNNNEIEYIENALLIDQTLWMLAFNNVLVNLNSYSGRRSQNYYLYQNEQGKFVPILSDLNLAFGSYKGAYASSDLNLKELQELDPLLHSDNKYKPLIHRLLNNPSYKKIYLSHLRSILYENFENGWYEKRANDLQNLIKGAYQEDKNQAYSYKDFQNSLSETIGKRSRIPGITELMSKRSKFLKKHPALRAVPPSISDIELEKRDKYVNQQVEQFTISAKVGKKPKEVKIFYRYNEHEDFLAVTMKDDGKYKDEKAGDNRYTVTIPSNKSGQIEYYIVAENAAVINYSPSNYMFERYVATLEDIN